MPNHKDIALHYKSLGLNPLPIKVGEKRPLINDHNRVPVTKEEIEKFSFEAIGVSTGIISGGLEVLDFDLKNADDPEVIMKVFKSKLPKKLLAKLVVQTTPSGGYHFIYRCEEISSSKVLATNVKGDAIIETRGEGGLIKCAPSKDYKFIQKDFDSIPIIKPEERLQLFISARMLSQTIEKEAKKRASQEDLKYLEKFPEYNQDIDIGLNLLKKHGWTEHSVDSEWINLTRPGKSVKDGISAGYHKHGKFLYVFSTSQDSFEIQKPYNNHAIFAILECDKNYPMAYAKLFEGGYGVEDTNSNFDIDALAWQAQLESMGFLSDDIEENSYLEQARKDEIEQGLPTGWVELDKYLRLKRNSLNFGLGYDGVGKSVFMLSLATASRVLHDWRWGMIMPENRTAMSRRRLIEIQSGKDITYFKDKPLMMDKYKQDSREYFKIVSNKKHYSLDDVMEMGKRLYEEFGISALLIDPYNFFKVTGGDGYGHNNRILSELRVFAEKYCSVYVMAHPSSTAPRTRLDPDTGYLMAPDKYSIQGGADFPYRVDDFFITHRIVNHHDPSFRTVMQVIVEKVKELETGGMVHRQGEYTALQWGERDGFRGYWDDSDNNPMYRALKAREDLKSLKA